MVNTLEIRGHQDRNLPQHALCMLELVTYARHMLGSWQRAEDILCRNKLSLVDTDRTVRYVLEM